MGPTSSFPFSIGGMACITQEIGCTVSATMMLLNRALPPHAQWDFQKSSRWTSHIKNYIAVSVVCASEGTVQLQCQMLSRWPASPQFVFRGRDGLPRLPTAG